MLFEEDTDAGVVSGLVVGVLFCLGTGVAVIIFVMRRRRKKRKDKVYVLKERHILLYNILANYGIII